MKHKVVWVTAAVALAVAGVVMAADGKPAAREAPALLADALRGGAIDADAAAAITRWILSEKDDAVAQGLVQALRSADLSARGPEAERWNATTRAMVALFERAMLDAGARRPRGAPWPELAALVDAAAPAVAEALEETDPSDRETMMRFLRAFAPSAGAMLPTLVQGLRHEQPAMRRGAAMALGAMGPAGRRAAGDLRRALDDPNPGVRDAAAAALREMEAGTERPRN